MSGTPTLVSIYTDGSSRGNPGPGGYGAVLECQGYPSKEISGGFLRTTNNRMELLAVIQALKTLKRQNVSVVIYSDSKYVVDAVEKKWVFGWSKKGFVGKKNPDLWKEYLKLHAIFKPKFVWVKGHNNHPQNERCDKLAVAAAQQENLPKDLGFEAAENKNNSLF